MTVCGLKVSTFPRENFHDLPIPSARSTVCRSEQIVVRVVWLPAGRMCQRSTATTISRGFLRFLGSCVLSQAEQRSIQNVVADWLTGEYIFLHL